MNTPSGHSQIPSHLGDCLLSTNKGTQVYEKLLDTGVNFFFSNQVVSKNNSDGDIEFGLGNFGDYETQGFAYKLREVYVAGFSLPDKLQDADLLFADNTEQLIKLLHEMGHAIVASENRYNSSYYSKKLSEYLLPMIQNERNWGMSSSSFYNTNQLKFHEQLADLIGVYLFGGEEFLYAHLFTLERKNPDIITSDLAIHIGVCIENIVSGFLSGYQTKSPEVQNSVLSRIKRLFSA